MYLVERSNMGLEKNHKRRYILEGRSKDIKWDYDPHLRFLGCLMEQTRFLSTILNIEYGILPIIKCIQRKGPIVSKRRTGQTIVLGCYE